MEKPRKGKRKADDSEMKKPKKLVLVDEPEAKRMKKPRKKQPAPKVQSSKDFPVKTIQSKPSKRLVVELEEPLPGIIRSRKEKKVKEKIWKQISSSESSDNEEQPIKHTNNRKTFKNPIQNRVNSSESESTSDNEEKPLGFRKEKIIKDPISSKNSSDSESISDNEKNHINNSKTFKNPIQNSSDSESTSDNEEKPQNSRKQKINKHPISSKSKSDSESTSDNEEKPQSFRKEKLKKDPYLSKKNTQSESTSNDKQKEKMKKLDLIYIQNSSDSESTSDNEETPQGFRKDKIIKDPISSKTSSDSESISDNEKNHTNNSKTFKNLIQNSSDSESTSDNEEKPQSFRKENVNKDPIFTKKKTNSESTSNDKEREKIKELDSIYIQNSSDSEWASDNEQETQLTKEQIIEEFKEPIHIPNSSDSESASDNEGETQRFSKKNSIGRKSMPNNNNKEKEILKDEAKKIDSDSDIMAKEDQLILIKRIQEYIPDNDHRSYLYRLRQLEWHKIAFKNYTIDQCKQIWTQLLKKVRHYRLLQEITSDIQEILKFNDLQAINMNPIRKPNRKHPAMPERPLSSYFIFYTKNCDKLAKKRPDLQGITFEDYILEKYRQLSLEEKDKYDLMAKEMRKDYEVKLAKFYDEHPYIKKEKHVYKKKIIVLTEKPPKEPQKAFELFMESVMKNEIPEDKLEFRRDCREKWKQMPDLVKLDWLNQAEEGIIEYQKKLAEYMARHPKFIPKKKPRMTGLTKEEKILKEKLSGKPKRPPLTPYRLFASTIILNSLETISPQERWKYCWAKWRAMSQEDKDHYHQLLKKKYRSYEKDFVKYLDTLTEDKRQEEIVRASKRRQPKL